MAPLVAIVGADGAGKSTTAHYLCSVITESQYAYLGLGSAAIGLRIRQWPVIGRRFERYLSAKARRARTPGKPMMGVVTALVIFMFARLRQRRFLRAMQHREAGKLVICDRYPQVQVAGLNDGPGLGAGTCRGWLVRWLARLERDLYTAMAHIPPTLVIRLHIDAQTAWSRKPDHDFELIQQKIATLSTLTYEGARVVEVDARLPEAQVRAICLRFIENLMEQGACQASKPSAQDLQLD
ncbi:hypothetical protein [Pseudomonas putida]|uniref:hypothetical protein n=1 Tax=Pseudomonas putida TaxID=303 RepID=UPI003905D524